MFLDTTDGMAILGYCGLGITGNGTEPSEWMSAVLRGRNFPLEQSLGVLAEAMRRELPKHMVLLRADGGPRHNLIIPAFIGNEVRLYTIDLVLGANRKSDLFLYTRHETRESTLARARTPRLAIFGSGAPYLISNMKKWIRQLLQLVNASDRKQASSYAVADYLAGLNREVHLRVSGTVGPTCIVAWRHRRDGIHKGGGAHQFYTHTYRDRSTPALPSIALGMDFNAVCEALSHFDVMQPGEVPAKLDKDEVNAKLAQLPDKPDENLR